MLEQVTEHFRAHDLMNPYLGPRLSLQVNVAKQVLSFVRVKSKPWAAQCCSASAEQKAIYVRRAHGMRNESGDLVGGKLDRVFVVYTPVNPLFVIDVRQQMQDGSLDIRRRREIPGPLRIGPANLLVGNVKNKRMVRP